MPLFNAKRNSHPSRLLKILGSSLLILCTLVPTAVALDTEIGARVCGPNPGGALITITQPTDDSVVNQAVVTFRGTVAGASQIVVELDGNYNGTVALANNQTTFETDITLPQGTHTVAMRATEICGGADGTDSAVLTYQPAVQPSSGAVTETAVGSNGTPTGVVISDDPIAESSLSRAIEQLPVIGPIVNFGANLATTIGLDTTLAANQSSVIAGIARVVVTVAGLTSIVLASTLAPVATKTIPGLAEVFTASSHRSMLYLGWVIRGVGACALIFAYFL